MTSSSKFGKFALKTIATQDWQQARFTVVLMMLDLHRRRHHLVVEVVQQTLCRLFGVRSVNEHDSAHTEEEIRILMDQSARSGIINKDELTLFDNIFEFSDRLAREIMLPRTDMDCLYADLSFADNMKIVYSTKHTRYPVCVEDKDQLIGFVHITDLLTADPDEELTLNKFLLADSQRSGIYGDQPCSQATQKRHSQLAIVVDEYGGTAGMLTTESILEENRR